MDYFDASLLLYLESCCVERGGKIDCRKISSHETNLMEKWRDLGYINFGRICFDDMNKKFSHFNQWVGLSKKAWEDAHAERISRYNRINEKRTWHKTSEGASL